MSAEGRSATHDVIADGYGPDFGADRFDNPRRLMAEHAGRDKREVAVAEVIVAVTQAAGGNPDENLTRAGLVD